MSLSDCTLENDHLFYKNCLQILEDDNLQLCLFQEVYDQAMAGHTRIAKTHDLLSQWYYWPKMVNTIWQYIRNCHVCSQAKLTCDCQGELLSLPVPQQWWQDLAIDFITNLPESQDTCFPGAKHIWVITDCLTKEHHFVPCAEITTSHLVWMFIQFVVRHMACQEALCQTKEASLSVPSREHFVHSLRSPCNCLQDTTQKQMAKQNVRTRSLNTTYSHT